MKYDALLASMVLLGLAASSPGATGMINAGEVLLPTGVDAQYSAAIDATTGYGYFGTSGADHTGYISMINLNGSTPTLVSSASENISAGVYGMLGMTVDTSNADPAKHYLYVGTATGQILKMSPGTSTTPPQVLATLNPTSNGKAAVLDGFMDSSGGYAYFISSSTTYERVLRVNLSNFSDAGTVQIPVGESASVGQMNSLRYGAIDTTSHYLYMTNMGYNATHGADTPDSPEICKINLQTAFKNSTGTSSPVNGTDYSVVDLSSTVAGAGIGRAGYNNPVIDEGIVLDTAHGYAYIASYNCDNTNTALNQQTWPYNQSVVARISLGSGATFPANPVAGVLNMQVGERDLTCGFLDPANGNIYFGTDNTYPAHVYMIHVGDGTAAMTEVGRLNLNPGTLSPYPPAGLLDGMTHVGSNATQYGEIYLRSGIIDLASNKLYFGTDSTPGQVVQVDINTSSIVSLSSPTGCTVIKGGTGAIGVTVGNSAAAGCAYLNYSLAAAVTGGSATLGAVTPAIGAIAPGAAQGGIVSATSSNVGLNTIQFTASDPNAANNPQAANVTLTVLDHSLASFDPNSTQVAKSINFGGILKNGNAGTVAFSIGNQAATYRVGLDLQSIDSNGAAALTTNLSTFSNLTAGSANSYTASLATRTSGTFSKTLTIHLADSNLYPGAAGSQTMTLTLNAVVGNATADQSNLMTSFGPALTAVTGLGSSYAGLQSTVTGTTVGLGGPMVGTTATIVAGTNSTGSDTSVAMQWRTRTGAEKYPTQTYPPTPATSYGLVSDVVNLSGMANDGTSQTDAFVLRLSYDPSLLVLGDGLSEQVLAQRGWIYLAWFNSSTGWWENAVIGNYGGTARFCGIGDWSDYGQPGLGDDLGRWGVDIADHTVWAVVDNGGQFAVVSEPGSLCLMGLAGLSLLRRGQPKR